MDRQLNKIYQNSSDCGDGCREKCTSVVTIDWPMNLVLTNPLSGKGVDTPLLPSQQLVIDAKFSHDRNDRKYELVAVVIHSGTTAGGHYFAYVKYGKNWFDCNDAVITPIDKSQVMSLKSFQYAIYTLLD